MAQKLSAVTVDTSNPESMAAFYSELLGWTILASQQSHAIISDGHSTVFFTHVDGYRPPSWPDGLDAPKRFHFDVLVDDTEAALALVTRLGGEVPKHQPGADEGSPFGPWIVALDPEGHPFCLIPE
ncbi:putative enzyme related to lactoylglutathione lyase [Streptomyces sp. SAI-170]|uniref:VOC family protein n=1 Tax=Streptomyces sp. SAI-170 TaxID=3377729 RepID=UPI003C7C8E53